MPARARPHGLTAGEHALAALIGEIVAERLWAEATGEPATQTDGQRGEGTDSSGDG